ncbi:hypothetical protein CXF95_26565 [Paraglaciecola sp. MB-3u-78]|jgi:hypothetical protein|nr:hypothetical protein CXF95_26565 [Paraglaciecola sp. MB-3u-78]
MTKLGTKKKPIRLLPDGSLRTKFVKSTSHVFNKNELVTEMSKMKSPKYGFDLYIKNLIRNPYLKAKDIRLGFLLFDLLTNKQLDPLFTTLPKEEFRISSIGEQGILYLAASRAVSDGYEMISKQSLFDLATRSKMSLTQSEIIKILNKLHSFFYITCTEICKENLASNRIGFKYKCNELPLSMQTKVVHIRLNQRFEKLDFTNQWKAIKRKKSKVKVT